MTTEVFLRMRQPAKAQQVVSELLADGVGRDRIRVHASTSVPLPGLQVPRVAYLPPREALLRGGIWGAILAAVPALLLLFFGGAGLAAVLVLAAGIAGGGLYLLARSGADNRIIEPRKDVLQQGEVLVVLHLEESDVEPLERRIDERHPEVMVLGSDPAGSPPFP